MCKYLYVTHQVLFMQTACFQLCAKSRLRSGYRSVFVCGNDLQTPVASILSTGGRLSICLTGVLLKPADRSANEDFFVFRRSYNEMAIESCGVP